MTQTPRTPESPGVAQLLKELASDSQALVRHEIDLAKTELQDSAVSIAKGSALVAGGIVLAALGGLVLLVFAVIGLGALLGDRYWLSSLLIGGILVLGALVLLLMGRKGIRGDSLKPDRAIQSARDTGQWARDEAREFKNEIAGKAS